MRPLLVCSLLGLAGCPTRWPHPTSTSDGGAERPDGAQARTDAMGRPPSDAAVPPAPDAATMPPVGVGTIIVMGMADLGAQAFGEAWFSHTDWRPPLGSCVANPSLGDSVGVGDAVVVTSSAGATASLAWDPANLYYYSPDFVDGLYGDGARITAEAPGDVAPGFSLSGIAPSSRLAGVDLPPLQPRDADLTVRWAPAGADLFFVELLDETQTGFVECSFPDDGEGRVPSALLAGLGFGTLSVYGMQVDDAHQVVGGWDLHLWIGTYVQAQTTLGLGP